MGTNQFKRNGRWSIQAIRKKTDELASYKEKLTFLHDIQNNIEGTKPTGRESLSANAEITLKKIKRYEMLIIKEHNIDDARLEWTGSEDSLINLFHTLKHTSMGKDNRPLLDATNQRIADFIVSNFNINWSKTTVLWKLKRSQPSSENINFIFYNFFSKK